MPILEKYFSKVPAGPKPEDMTTEEPQQFAEKSLVIREQTQPFYIEGYHRPSYHDPDDAVYDAIRTSCRMGEFRACIGAWCATSRSRPRLQGSARSRRKISGPVRVLCGAAARPYAQEMRDAIHKEIEKLKSADVTDDELPMYKTRTRADLLRGLADNQGLAIALAEYQTRFGDWRELFRQLDRVDKVTKADIRRVANRVFVAQ